MAKKIVKVEDTKKSGLDLGKLAKTIMENGDTIEKVTDTIGDLFGKDDKKTTKKSSSKKSSKKSSSDITDVIGDLLSGSDSKTKSKKSSSKSDGLSTVIDLAGKFLNK